MNSFVGVLMVGFVLFVLWRAMNPRWQFKVVVSENAVAMVRGLPVSSRSKLESFFSQDLKCSAKLVMTGRRERDGRLVLWIQGTDDAGVKQRIRNFFIANL